ncbi:beta-galactosidase [Pedobacter sp. HMF7647]|uniref:Beta-galactosidase n=1 Tax=Hufsiella arboris TaxID=2695275 RepID=A0A7K1Y9A3_9SPHI|nr:sugar-binding domain-containing protein [Hufsiella arboris]MXV51000.1 beta-galactosidase [Hufsiella arboris]
MKKLFAILFLFYLVTETRAQTSNWKPLPGKIQSEWASKVDPQKTLPEYPRPQFVRNDWQNLNGLWDYSIVPVSATSKPSGFEGKILVPFAVESSLSGVGRTVGKDSILWYKRSFAVSSGLKGKTVLLHFGAVDWRTEVFVNGKKAGDHEGGFDPFSFNITPYLKGGNQEIIVKVWDPTDKGPQPRGKQVSKPEGIWYTPVTGIWQTVWLEGVPKTYVISTKQTPDVDQKSVSVTPLVWNAQKGDKIVIAALDGQNKIAESSINSGETAILKIPDAKLWDTKNPFLYNLKISVIRGGKTVDEVKSYFAMRKISIAADKDGVQRMMLNDKFVFQFGPLDQGWWPDGLYTAPTDEALKFDVDQTKAMGFNMIRKHIKVEPARWYYYCDKAGMLVWQDMPSGDLGNRWDPRPGIIGRATDQNRTAESEGYYRKEWNAIMNSLYNVPSIVVWTPFNEAWGQFKTEDISSWTMKKDPSRLVNSASGGNFYDTGHIIDLHNYPEPAMPDAKLFGSKRAVVLGEFGGLGLPVEGHTWQQKNNWGYQSFKTPQEMFDRYTTFVNSLLELSKKGLSAAVYTQTTDVEGEINGFMTYDRVMKVPLGQLKNINDKLTQTTLAD